MPEHLPMSFRVFSFLFFSFDVIIKALGLHKRLLYIVAYKSHVEFIMDQFNISNKMVSIYCLS